MSHKALRNALVSALVLLMTQGFSRAQSLEEAAREMAGKIAAVLGPGRPAALTFRNLSSLSPLEALEAQRALERALKEGPLRIEANSDSAARIGVTLSENLESVLWVAEIQTEGNRQVVMLGVPRASLSGARETTPSVTLERTLLIELDAPVLDAALLDGRLLVLQISGVSLYARSEHGWTVQGARPLPPGTVWPRDPRGRLELGQGFFQAHLPGLICAGTASPSLSLECKKSDAQWPLELPEASLAPGRNYYVKEGLPRFFAVARTVEHGSALWLLSSPDRQVHVYDDAWKPAGTFEGWGSDIATVTSACGAGRQVLATGIGGRADPDTVRAYEIMGGQPLPAGSPATFPGSVTALWTAADGAHAMAVSRDLTTGRYALFELAISCGH